MLCELVLQELEGVKSAPLHTWATTAEYLRRNERTIFITWSI